MTRQLTLAGAGRRFVALTALRWLPTGLVIPVMVLLASARGLSPAEIGVAISAHSAVALLLELPTGGLADAVGRRPVLVASGLLHLAAVLALSGAGSLAGFAGAMALLGAGRALDTGPLEAWYVDAVQQLAPGTDVTPGLARAAVADGGGLALGAVVGGLLPSLLASRGDDAIAAPFLLAAALDAVYLVAVLALVTPLAHEAERRAGTGAGAALRAGVRAVPSVVRATAVLAARDAVLRVLLAISVLAGVSLAALELLGPLHLAELTGSTAAGTAAFGVVSAVSFGAAALGAALATTARRLARGSVAVVSGAAAGIAAAAVTGFALAPAVVVAGAACALSYLVNAVAWPLRDQVLHSRVTAVHRSTTVSAASLALMTGGITGSLLLPLLAGATSLSTALVCSAGALVLTALLSARLPRAGARVADSAATAGSPAPA